MEGFIILSFLESLGIPWFRLEFLGMLAARAGLPLSGLAKEEQKSKLAELDVAFICSRNVFFGFLEDS